MRVAPVLLVLIVAACSDDGMTRTFTVSRDAAPETMAATQMPLSMPPSLAMRPTRPGALGLGKGTSQSSDEAPPSAGQEALVDAAGPSAYANVRRAIDENSGLVYPPPDFVNRLMTWSAPPGSTSVITSAPKGGWFSRVF